MKLFVSELSVPAHTCDTPEPESGTCDPDIQTLHSQETEKGGVLSTPAVRNVAKLYNINIKDVCGTGKDGRVLKEDVLRYAASKGFIKDTPSSVTSDSIKNISEREDIHQDESAADRHDYEDETYPLRYVIK